MAKRRARPGRTLVTFLAGVAVLFGLVALAGSWQPQLGLDLQGGTRITLVAQGEPSSANLQEARSIIDQRVNGSGVSEADVVTQGSNIITVEIPGDTRRDLVEVVERQAQLRFRLVACGDGSTPCGPPAAAQPQEPVIPPTAEPSPSTPAAPAPTSSAPTTSAPAAPGNGQQTPRASESATGGANRVAPGFADDETTSPTASPTDTASAPAADQPSTPAASGTPAPSDVDESAVVPLDQALQFMNGAYTQADYEAFNAYQCDENGLIGKVEGAPRDLPEVPVDNPLQPLVSCSEPQEARGDQDALPSFKYLLSPAVISGTDLDSASSGIPNGQVQYAVNLDIGGDGANVFAEASSRLETNVDQFAIVLDGTVLSAPTFQGQIPDGNAQITGSFTQTEANDLATSLKYGSLPIAFDDPSVETIGPSLAGDQLSAGLIAGAFGLGLVLIYCLLYYRGLGIVVVASLLAASAVSYALVLLLSETAGFTLTLPGIAGLIIAVGITADSFIIFFERIRDEMRDGRSMRVAVESGWKRAKVTRLAAQVVSLLSAVVLYIFATGAVKGFGFALGLTTLVDLAILFWFTKPMVSWLATFRFFNSGSRLSGLSPETLGIDGPADRGARAPAVAGGRV